MTLEDKIKSCIVMPDIHVPYQDDRAIEPVLKCIRDLKPDKIVQLGDFYDFYDLSKFDKDPNRVNGLQEEIDAGKKLWMLIHQASPKSELIMLEGNHESRLQSYLKKNPEMHSLRSLKLDNIIEVKDLGVKVFGADKDYMLNESLLLTHGAKDDGCRLSQFAGYSAKMNLDRKNISMVHGHTHRMGSSMRTDYSGLKVAYEIGCLCSLKPEYMKNPNWQQGFAVIHYGKRFFNVQAIPITKDYNFYYGGKLYRGKK